MDDNKYNFNSMWKTFSATGGENLMLSVYEGNASLVVFKRSKGEEKNSPIVKMSLAMTACIKISEICKTLINSQPDTRIPFIQLEFSKEQRTYDTKTTFVFYKDEKRQYGVEITNKFLPTPLKFPFKCPGTFSNSNEPMTDELKSELAMKEFIKMFDFMIPTAMLLSHLNMRPMNSRRQIQKQPAGMHTYSNNQSKDPYHNSSGEEEQLFG